MKMSEDLYTLFSSIIEIERKLSSSELVLVPVVIWKFAYVFLDRYYNIIADNMRD